MIHNVLVTGATGAIGPGIVHYLHTCGHTVRTLSLDSPAPGLFPVGVEVRVGDITDSETVQSAMQGIEGVVHLAALLHIVNPPPSLREKYERINVGGTARVVETALRTDVERIVFFSTIAVYGPGNGSWLTEDSSPHPDSYYAETKLAAEHIVLQARRKNGQPLGTVLRLGAVYGSRIKGNYQQLVRSLFRRRFILVGRGENYRTLVYEKDVAVACELALRHDAAVGRIYNVTDGQVHTMREIILAICKSLGRPFPRISLPLTPVAWGLALLENTVGRLGFPLPVTRTLLNKYIEDIQVSGDRLQKELGFIPHYDLQTGWQETIENIKKIGAL